MIPKWFVFLGFYRSNRAMLGNYAAGQVLRCAVGRVAAPNCPLAQIRAVSRHNFKSVQRKNNYRPHESAAFSSPKINAQSTICAFSLLASAARVRTALRERVRKRSWNSLHCQQSPTRKILLYRYIFNQFFYCWGVLYRKLKILFF